MSLFASFFRRDPAQLGETIYQQGIVPLLRSVQMTCGRIPDELSQDCYVLGYFYGQSSTLTVALTKEKASGTDVASVFSFVIGATFGQNARRVFDVVQEAVRSNDRDFMTGAERGSKVAALLIGNDSFLVNDADVIEARREVRKHPQLMSSVGATEDSAIGGFLHNRYFLDYIKSQFPR